MDFIIDSNYSNNAWGYKNKGFLIASNGQVLSYSLTEEDNDTLYSKIRHSRLVKILVLTEITKLGELLYQAESGVTIKEEGGGNDMGLSTITGYLFFPDGDKVIELSTRGNFNSSNNSRVAQQLIHEIKEIGFTTGDLIRSK